MVRVRVKVSRALVALVVVAVGVVLVAVGVWCIYWPAGLIVGGVLTTAVGLFLIDDGRRANEPVGPRRRPPG